MKRKKSRFSGIHSNRINPKGFHPSQIKFYVVLLPVVVFMLLPMIFIFSNAFKPPDELFAYPPRFLVMDPTDKNFSDLFARLARSGVPVSRYLFNSVLITAVTVGASGTSSSSWASCSERSTSFGSVGGATGGVGTMVMTRLRSLRHKPTTPPGATNMNRINVTPRSTPES